MKRQVTFANVVKFYNNVYGHQQEDSMSRSTGLQQSKRGTFTLDKARASVKLRNDSRTLRLPEIRQHKETIQIPKAVATAPFLVNSHLTPAQRRYLHTVADTHSTAHVHKLIQQHYMNVLHRCILAGQHLVKDSIVGNPKVESLPFENNIEIETHPGPKSREGKSSGRSGKTTLPKIPNRHWKRLPDNSPSKHRKDKKHNTKRVTRPRRSELWEDDLPFDLDEADDSLSEVLSSLSMREEEDDHHLGSTASPIYLPAV